ncbi:unnamed protein product [Prorocentrum cordatum]|uniref:Uncharacterized protein n=1 Tax=Prorocentrum cordatum TaxID=2364126 RepID=A0ABN9SY75_9DINO|nr:unnamed protein product [Polarella glacialis]
MSGEYWGGTVVDAVPREVISEPFSCCQRLPDRHELKKNIARIGPRASGEKDYEQTSCRIPALVPRWPCDGRRWRRRAKRKSEAPTGPGRKNRLLPGYWLPGRKTAARAAPRARSAARTREDARPRDSLEPLAQAAEEEEEEEEEDEEDVEEEEEEAPQCRRARTWRAASGAPSTPGPAPAHVHGRERRGEEGSHGGAGRR